MDAFALLGISQNSIVEEALLKDAWHRATLDYESLETVNHAYAILRDPGKRIEHLLALHGKTSLKTLNPGADLFDLFITVSNCLQNSDGLVRSINEAKTSLHRATLTGQLLSCLDDLTAIRKTVDNESLSRTSQLDALSGLLPDLSVPQWEMLAALGHDFTFLAKWENEIIKRETQLQEALIGKIS